MLKSSASRPSLDRELKEGELSSKLDFTTELASRDTRPSFSDEVKQFEAGETTSCNSKINIRPPKKSCF